MYRQPEKPTSKSVSPKQSFDNNYNDLLILKPSMVNGIIWPVVYYFEGEVGVSDPPIKLPISFCTILTNFLVTGVE